ncbi:MAG: hypothetical protein WDO16_00205 [Bacteroidota bacterium]
MKSFVSILPLKDADITSKDLTKKILTAFETLQPVLEFINRAIE